MNWYFIILVSVESNVYRPIVGADGGGEVDVDLDLVAVGSEPVGVRCPHCQEDVMTTAVYTTTRRTHVAALLLGFFFWWLCCCLLPYFLRVCKNVEHYCPHCRQYLGVYARSSVV